MSCGMETWVAVFREACNARGVRWYAVGVTSKQIEERR
jgi:hypothetical protein